MPVVIVCRDARLCHWVAPVRAVLSTPQHQHVVTVLLGLLLCPGRCRKALKTRWGSDWMHAYGVGDGWIRSGRGRRLSRWRPPDTTGLFVLSIYRAFNDTGARLAEVSPRRGCDPMQRAGARTVTPYR